MLASRPSVNSGVANRAAGFTLVCCTLTDPVRGTNFTFRRKLPERWRPVLKVMLGFHLIRLNLSFWAETKLHTSETILTQGKVFIKVQN